MNMNFRSVQVDGGITSIALRGQGHQVCKKVLLAKVNSSSHMLSGVVEDNPELMRDNTKSCFTNNKIRKLNKHFNDKTDRPLIEEIIIILIFGAP